ncbi:MAG TPA: response regulator, partial [Pirellulaceae bacterium]|nr:response regulator [Pirellulaceae bacterium]
MLVIDDDADTRENLCDILELDGYRYEAAGTASELLERSNWDDVALVLLDRKLPDGSPQEILPRLKVLAPQVAVIIVTGYADIEGAISALQSGAADYILKPINPDALRASVRRVIQRQRDLQQIACLSSDLEESEVRYRALFENTMDGLVILDDESRIFAANPAARSMLGWTGGASEMKLESLKLDNEGQMNAATRGDFLGPGKHSGEYWIAVPGGRIAIEYRAVENSAPGLHLISMRDVTARKCAEERARQAERLAAIGETMTALVHESRNALQRSKASLELLKLEVEDRPEATKLANRVERAQEDLHQLFEEVRQWAAPLKLRREVCNLRELWQETWCLVGQANPARKAKLVEELTCEPICHADEFALGQVFRNIFENAIEVAPPGSNVTIRCAHPPSGNGNVIVLTIRDEGPGLTAEQQQRIFEPFFTTKAKGTG